jgi:hypothetical protein
MYSVSNVPRGVKRPPSISAQPSQDLRLLSAGKILMHKPQIYESMEWAVGANKRHAPKRSSQLGFREY